MIAQILLYWPQIGIALFGVSAIWLLNDKREHVRKWGPVMGIIGQPFWAWETYSKSQWFILALCVLYSWGWCKGLYGYWWKPWREARYWRKKNLMTVGGGSCTDDSPYRVRWRRLYKS